KTRKPIGEIDVADRLAMKKLDRDAWAERAFASLLLRCARRKGSGHRGKRKDAGNADHASTSSAWERSAIMSSICSIPTETRTTSGPAPDSSSSCSDNWLCVVEAGWMISDRVSPRFA